MKKYAKLNDSRIQYAPNPLRLPTGHIFNPSEETLREAGYKPVTETPYPEDGKTYAGSWEETETEIVRVWTEVPTPEPTPTEADRIDALEAAVTEMAEVIFGG